MALWDIYFVQKFIPKVLNIVSFNFFYENNNFLSLCLIDLAFLRRFDAVSKVVITALSQKIFESNLGIPESRELFPCLVFWYRLYCVNHSRSGLPNIVLDISLVL